MFKKKKCKNCGEKINDSYNFCPYCRVSLKGLDEDDFGMLGKNDYDDEFDELSGMFGGISGKMINKMFAGAMKMLEKEMRRAMEQDSTRTNVELYINGKRVNPNKIKVIKKPTKEQVQKGKSIVKLPSSNSKKFSGLPKKEPSAHIRRLSNRVVYEINLPGVKSTDDLSIIQLENSIEIKALAKDKVFYKIIPINLPIRGYNLSKGKLILELDSRE